MFVACIASADTLPRIIVSGRVNYNQAEQDWLVYENFEGVGTPSGWTTSGSPNFDYTTNAIAGSESVYLATTADYTYKTYTVAGSVWYRIRWRPMSLAANYDLLTIRDNAGATIVAKINLRTTGGFRVYQGTVFSASSSGMIASNQNCYLWLQYHPVTNATDGRAALYFSTNSTKPASPTIVVTNGDATLDAARVRLLGGPGVFDEVRASATEIF